MIQITITFLSFKTKNDSTKMKNSKLFIFGIIITIVIDYLALSYGNLLNLNSSFFPGSFGTHTFILSLSIIAIILLKKYVNYKIAIPKFKQILKPVLFGFLTSLIMNMILMSILASIGKNDNVETQMPTSNMSVLQIFIFVFIYASLAEEILFRGFLQNFLSPLKDKGLTFLKRKLSLPVMISAVVFGLSHLILLNPERNNLFVIGIVISATVLGFIAGYYQEKYNNNAYAILVHMAGNLMIIIGATVMNLIT